MLSAQDKIAFLMHLEERERRRKTRRLFSYTPYPKQLEFHEAGAEFRERLLMAGNQLGKCVLEQTLIPDWIGRNRAIGELYALNSPFQVMAFNGYEQVKAIASRAIKKPAEHAVRLYLSDGEHLDCALNHRILTRAGYSFVSQLLPSVPCLPACDSASYQSAQSEDARNWRETALYYRARCSADRHQCDAQPHVSEAADQVSSTSQGGAQAHNRHSSPSGDLFQSRCTDILRRSLGRLSSLGAKVHRAARSAAFLSLAVCTSSPRTTLIRRVWQRLHVAGFVFLRSVLATYMDQFELAALVSPSGMADKHIVAYRPIGVHDIYDMTVPGYQNYVAAGVVNHNTWSMGFEVAMHLTGRYPNAGEIFYPDALELEQMASHDEKTAQALLENLTELGLLGADVYPDGWKGYRFNRPIWMWAASKDGSSTRDNPQRILIGTPALKEEWGTGAIPLEDLQFEDREMRYSMRQGTPHAIDNIQIKSIFGGTSILQFKTYEQGREAWQGPTLDLVWFDEEPPADIYEEGKTRTNRKEGPVVLTFTPLLGMSAVVRQFISTEDVEAV